MASDTQEVLYKIFAALSGDGGGSITEGVTITSVEAATGNSPPSNGAKDSDSTGASVATEILKSGLGLVPMVTTLFGLFGGGEKEEPAPLAKHALPANQNFQAAATEAGLTDVDYDQFGRPRAVEKSVAGVEARSTTGTSAPQINVTVQAMDARSFLDRSGEIAAAVREAMLNLNSINDVVTDL